MADGKLRRVDYVADNQGFHILRDTADNTGRYIKREAEADPLVQPDLIRTRMTSYMDSSSLRDDGKDFHSMSNNMMGRDMTSTNMPRNSQMSTMYRSSDMMNQDMSSNIMNMMGRDMTSNMMSPARSIGMMSHGMTNNMMGHGMTNNMMGHDMTSSIAGRDMSTNMLNRNSDRPMMGQTTYTNKMGHGDMTSNMGISSDMMERNMMGHDMYSNIKDSKNKLMSSNIKMGQNLMTPINRMNQRIKLDTMPSQFLNAYF